MSVMTCREFESVVHGLVRMELLDVNLREAALDHAARCSSCAERMAEATALAEVTEIAGRSLREEQTPSNVETVVLAAFRTHHRRTTWRRSFEWAAVGAVAAMALVVLWTATGRSREKSLPIPQKNVSSQSNQPEEAKVIAPSPKDGLDQSADVEEADSSDTLAYAASDFVPVPFTDEIPSDDPGMVVRVQLTRSSLAQLGYPVTEIPDEDLIPADVLVDQDGWPRGVKLAQ